MNELLSFPTATANLAIGGQPGGSSVERYRRENPAAHRWAVGCGLISHTRATQTRVFALVERLASERGQAIVVPFFDVLHAADRLASADMWLLVHDMYAGTIHLDGRDVVTRDFKPHPDESAASALNLVPARVGYLAAKAIDGNVPDWVEPDSAVCADGALPDFGNVDVHLRCEEGRLCVSLDNAAAKNAEWDDAGQFAPFFFDGRDPAAFAWAIFEIESGRPHGTGVGPKGAGFYPEGASLAHAMLLGDNPRASTAAAARFNETARRLWVPPPSCGEQWRH